MSAFRKWSTILVVSHLAAGLLGLGVGVLYANHKRPTVQAMLRATARKPVADAARLAYRYGTASQARAALGSLVRIPATNELEWGDVMLSELKLAVLDGELRGSSPSPHLDAARTACRQVMGRDCEPEALRAAAMRLVHKKR